MFLPFRNVTRRPEHEWLVAGAPLMFAQSLGQFRDLHLVSEEALAAARRRLRIPMDSTPDASRLRTLARETGAWTAVTGNVFASGSRLRVTVQAMDVASGRVIVRAEQEVAGDADLRPVFDALAVRLLEPAGVPPTGASLVALTTTSVDAYREYVGGIQLYHRSQYRDALEAFQRAVRLDSTFALAWVGVATSVVSARGFQEMMSPGSLLYQAVDRAVRQAPRLPPAQAAHMRSLQAFIRARFGEARRIADSILAADPHNLPVLESLATLYGMSVFMSQAPSAPAIAAEVNRGAQLAQRLLELDPQRTVAYSLPVMIYAMSGGVFWGRTWATAREFTSLPVMLLAVTTVPDARYVPLFRDSIYMMPGPQFDSLPLAERDRLRRPGADRAMQWVEEWLASAPSDADAHLWASRVAELQGDYGRALREFTIADSLGIQTGLENVPGRRLSLMVLTGDFTRAGAYADSLLGAGAMRLRPFLSAVDRRWTFGAPALLLSRRWESAARLADIVNGARKLDPACQSLGHEMVFAEFPPPVAVRRAVMDTVRAHVDEVRAGPLAPCVTSLSGGLVPPD